MKLIWYRIGVFFAFVWSLLCRKGGEYWRLCFLTKNIMTGKIYCHLVIVLMLMMISCSRYKHAGYPDGRKKYNLRCSVQDTIECYKIYKRPVLGWNEVGTRCSWYSNLDPGEETLQRCFMLLQGHKEEHLKNHPTETCYTLGWRSGKSDIIALFFITMTSSGDKLLLIRCEAG